MALAVKERQRRYRESKRKAGFRLLQIWVPDTSDPKFAEEARRQSRLLARQVDPEEGEFMRIALEKMLANEPDYDWGDAKP
jgi:hypothetical protein